MEQTVRISRLTIGRLVNLGNYEHIRYEVTAEIAPGGDVVATMRRIEDALGTLAEKCAVSDRHLEQAYKILAMSPAERGVYEEGRISEYREAVRRYEEWQARQNAARATLGAIGMASEFTDVKDTWVQD